jgi:predicted transcriptional regulator
VINPTPKQARALALRRAGKTWVTIAREMGMTPRNAQTCAGRAQIKEYRLAEAAKEQVG